MKRKIKATIRYMVDKYHPEYLYIKNPEQEQEYTDTYTFDENYFGKLNRAEMETYCKHDLMLVAGGGYTAAHIHNIKFTFAEV